MWLDVPCKVSKRTLVQSGVNMHISSPVNYKITLLLLLKSSFTKQFYSYWTLVLSWYVINVNFYIWIHFMQGCFIIIITFFRLVSVTSKEKVKARPPALNTVELMRVASSGLGMGPHHAMQIAEKLYTQGYISYPRTETTKYPENFDLLYVYLLLFIIFLL